MGSISQEQIDKIRYLWSKNAFINLLNIQIDEVGDKTSKISIEVDRDIHTNHWLGVHGGVLATMADVNAGLIGASIGKVVVTINININYISKPRGKGRLIAVGDTLHAGRTTMIVHSQIRDEDNRLICDATLTMLLAGELDDLLK